MGAASSVLADQPTPEATNTPIPSPESSVTETISPADSNPTEIPTGLPAPTGTETPQTTDTPIVSQTAELTDTPIPPTATDIPANAPTEPGNPPQSETATLPPTNTETPAVGVTPTDTSAPEFTATPIPTDDVSPTPDLSPTETPSDLPSPTVGEETGTVTGRVSLQGISDASGITISVDTGSTTITDNNDPNFILSLPPGKYTITAVKSKYLAAIHSELTIVNGESTELPAVTLLTGDTNGDGKVDARDLARIGNDYGKTSGFSVKSDLNDDGLVNIFDLVLATQNLGASENRSW